MVIFLGKQKKSVIGKNHLNTIANTAENGTVIQELEIYMKTNVQKMNIKLNS